MSLNTLRPELSTPRRPVVELSTSLKRVLIDHFRPEDLRHLASLMESESSRMTARSRLDGASVVELAEMIVAGRTPTIGWWRRHTAEEQA